MSGQYQQNKVSAAIWDWQNRKQGERTAPSLLFSMITLAIGWAIGGLFYIYGHMVIAGIAFGISTFVFIASRFFPTLYFGIERIFQKLSVVVGTVLTWICLVPFFYICFGMGRISQLLKKKDPMQRALQPEAKSYWQSCKESASVEQYKRQF